MVNLFKKNVLLYLVFGLFISSFNLQNLKSIDEIKEMESLEETRSNPQLTTLSKIKKTIKSPKVYIPATIITGTLAFLLWKNNPSNRKTSEIMAPNKEVHSLKEILRAKEESIKLRNDILQNKERELTTINDKLVNVFQSNKSEEEKKRRLTELEAREVKLKGEITLLKEEQAGSLEGQKVLAERLKKCTS